MHHADKQARREAERSEAELNRTLQEVARLNAELNTEKAARSKDRETIAKIKALLGSGHSDRVIVETLETMFKPSPVELGETPLYAEVS